MTVGPTLLLDLVAGITSPDGRERRNWADVTASEFDDYDGLDDDERRALAPAHVWCLCIEPSVEVREYFLDSVDTLAVRRAVSPTVVAEVLAWLAVTGTDPRTEVDYVASLREIVDANGAVAEVALTPDRAAPFVDVLRGITSASEQERAGAARVVPELLPGLRREEQWGLTGVLARAAIAEDDDAVRRDQLGVLAEAHRVGAVHAHDRGLLTDKLTGASLGPAERRLVALLDKG